MNEKLVSKKLCCTENKTKGKKKNKGRNSTSKLEGSKKNLLFKISKGYLDPTCPLLKIGEKIDDIV